MNNESTTTKEFKVKLPVVAGATAPDSPAETKEFFVKNATTKTAREFFKRKRKRISLQDDATSRAAYDVQLATERNQIMKSDPKDRDSQRLTEIAEAQKALQFEKNESDEQYFAATDAICHAVLETTLPLSAIDWDNADRKEINGAIDFFSNSITESSFEPKS